MMSCRCKALSRRTLGELGPGKRVLCSATEFAGANGMVSGKKLALLCVPHLASVGWVGRGRCLDHSQIGTEEDKRKSLAGKKQSGRIVLQPYA